MGCLMSYYVRHFRNYPLPKDRYLGSLFTSWYVRSAAMFDDFFAAIITGTQRVGKTSYACQVGAEVFGEWRAYTQRIVDKQRGLVEAIPYYGCVKPNYEMLKKYIVFLPRDFLKTVSSIPVGKKEPLLIWDDAGFWLYALDWYEPFVKTVNKYIQLVGRRFACLIFTTPSDYLMSSKVLEALPDMLVIKIRKVGFDNPYRKIRQAVAYQRWNYADGKKGGVYKMYVDEYNAMLPNDFYEWYKPMSESYLEQANILLKREVSRLDRRFGKAEKEQIQEVAYRFAGTPEEHKELLEIYQQFYSSS